ncbi:MAG: transglycosylase SLT domain-containing protein [Acidobacteriales bacterium]|nr:transglycosylase SLT domain-containing protein [Terriglobales bacterium]
MARQLLQDRSPAAYSGVEAFALAHARDDAGALAWLVVGYGRILDHDYAKAIDPLSHAKPRAGELEDYVAYDLGYAYLETGHLAEAIAVLNGFEKTYPDSLLIRDAQLAYVNALLAEGRGQEGIAALEAVRQPVRADFELALGRCYAAAGDTTKAAATLQHIYLSMPLSPEAGQAEAELKKLSAATVVPAPAVNDLRMRADLLARGKRFTEAAHEYAALLDQSSPADRPLIQLAMASALRHAGQNREAKQVLESIPNTPAEINAERLFNLAEIARTSNDDAEFLRLLDQLRQAAPASSWLEQALLSAANIYLLRRDFDHAIDCFRELAQRFPNGSHAPYAHWKAAWLTLRQGRNADAKAAFEQQIALYPASGEVPAALYWRARLAEEDNDPAMAQAYYQKLSSRFRNYYYGDLARQRLSKIPAAPAVQQYALLDRVPPLDSVKVTADLLPADNLRIQKAQLLENGALLDFSVRELRGAAEQDKGNWLPAETARLYRDAGRFDIAIEVLKRAAPNYFAVDLPNLPRAYWEGLFPKPYWGDLTKFAAANALDPYLVASLIRQESEFNTNAVSRANAVGLMQLLPKTAKKVAKEVKMKHFNAAQLFTPAINLQLGSRYFRAMVDKFGAFEYALAAYNAGSDRVQEWQQQAHYRDPQEFVESIPFTETREYVQAILRNANVYRQLYGAP